MTIEQDMLDRANALRVEWGLEPYPLAGITRKDNSICEAFCRALEELAAQKQAMADFKAEVSRVAEGCYKAMRASPDGNINWRAEVLHSFIIQPPVDPLYECVREALPGSMPDHHALAITKNLRAAADKRGLKLEGTDQ